MLPLKIFLDRERGVFRVMGHYRCFWYPQKQPMTSCGGRQRLHSAIVASPRVVSPYDAFRLRLSPSSVLCDSTWLLVAPAPAPRLLLLPPVLACSALLLVVGGEAESNIWLISMLLLRPLWLDPQKPELSLCTSSSSSLSSSSS